MGGYGGVTVVEVVGVSAALVGRNWKSARRRLAHLLAEKVLLVVVALGGLRCFLLGFDGGGNGVDNGMQRLSLLR